jgi:sterol 3beta-glucosyltransferase
VDVTSGFKVASELLELDAVESGPLCFNVREAASEYNKSVPKLNVAMLVVGTRGDVQPFIAFAKRLQVPLHSHIVLFSFNKYNVLTNLLKEMTFA